MWINSKIESLPTLKNAIRLCVVFYVTDRYLNVTCLPPARNLIGQTHYCTLPFCWIVVQLNLRLDTMSAVENNANGLSHEVVVPSQDREKIDLALRTIRCLVADLCEQYKGGHPG